MLWVKFASASSTSRRKRGQYTHRLINTHIICIAVLMPPPTHIHTYSDHHRTEIAAPFMRDVAAWFDVSLGHGLTGGVGSGI